jgi:hypothetical protein
MGADAFGEVLRPPFFHDQTGIHDGHPWASWKLRRGHERSRARCSVSRWSLFIRPDLCLDGDVQRRGGLVAIKSFGFNDRAIAIMTPVYAALKSGDGSERSLQSVGN